MESAALLRRHPACCPPAASTWRINRVRRVWYDTPRGTLASANLALAEEPAGWQLGPILTGKATWLVAAAWPASPSSTVLWPTADAALGTMSDEPLLPVVAFEGERWLNRVVGQDVEMCLVKGAWRTLAAERPFCHLQLAGTAASVATLAASLGRTIDLALPLASPTAEALAFARGGSACANAVSLPTLATGMTVEAGFVEIVSRLTEALIFWSRRMPAGFDPAEPQESVHQMRVAVRRLRSAVRAFAVILPCPAIDAIKAGLRDLGHALGPARDWDVFITETLAEAIAVLPQEPTLLRLHRSAVRLRQAAYRNLQDYFSGSHFARLTVDLACFTVAQPWGAIADDLLRERQRSPIKSYAAEVLRHQYRKMTHGARDIAALPPEALHDLRLRGKQLRYVAEFFAPLFVGKAADRFVHRLARLQEQLGALNDGAVAAELMCSMPAATRRAQGIVQGFVANRARQAREALGGNWKRFADEKVFWR